MPDQCCPVLSADEETFGGNIPSLTVCIENAVVEVTYDGLLLVLTDVYFTVDGGEPGSFYSKRLSGSILKRIFSPA